MFDKELSGQAGGQIDGLPSADSFSAQDWEAMCVPAEHSADPFACPCCANVFEQCINATGLDLSAQGDALERAPAACGSLFLVNARIRTMNPKQAEADSLLVQDGRIIWVGQADDAPEDAEQHQRIDANGKTVLPGFIDPHMHLAPLAMLHSFENLGPFRFERSADALAHLAEKARHTESGEWLVGRQFDPSLQEGPAALTAEMLDEVSREHPIFIYNASLHLAYCNTLALEIAGIDNGATAPSGSELGRYPSGEPNGVLKGGGAMAMVARYNPYVKNQDVAQGCLDVFESASKLGLTMLCDQGTGLFQGASELDLYAGLRDSGRMRARFRYSLGEAAKDRWDELDLVWGEGDAWVRNTGWKIVSDGSNQGRTGLQREAYLAAEDENDKGLAYIETDALNEAVARRLGEGWAVCVHANGDGAIDRVLDAYERAKAMGFDPAEKRCRIEHCSILHDEQIARMDALGVSPSFLIGHVFYWGAAFVNDVFGLEKAEKLDRTGACEARGIRWTIHSDDPVTEMNPLRCIQNAVTRAMWRSDDLLAPDERVSIAAALRAMTIDAAWQCHSDHEVGSLEVGKLADFIVLDEDPLVTPTDQLEQIQVLETWVNGEQV